MNDRNIKNIFRKLGSSFGSHCRATKSGIRSIANGFEPTGSIEGSRPYQQARSARAC